MAAVDAMAALEPPDQPSLSFMNSTDRLRDILAAVDKILGLVGEGEGSGGIRTGSVRDPP